MTKLQQQRLLPRHEEEKLKEMCGILCYGHGVRATVKDMAMARFEPRTSGSAVSVLLHHTAVRQAGIPSIYSFSEIARYAVTSLACAKLHV